MSSEVPNPVFEVGSAFWLVMTSDATALAKVAAVSADGFFWLSPPAGVFTIMEFGPGCIG